MTSISVTPRRNAEQVSGNVGQQLATNGQCHVGRRPARRSVARRSSVSPSVSDPSVVGQPVGQRPVGRRSARWSSPPGGTGSCRGHAAGMPRAAAGMPRACRGHAAGCRGLPAGRAFGGGGGSIKSELQINTNEIRDKMQVKSPLAGAGCRGAAADMPRACMPRACIAAERPRPRPAGVCRA